MVIDSHYHPMFIQEICDTDQKLEVRKQDLAYYRVSSFSFERALERMTSSGVDICFLLPHDSRSINGDYISNEDVKKLVDMSSGRFIGFASVDPTLPDAEKIVESAFANLNLSGLKLNTARHQMLPTDVRLEKVYEVCEKYHRPIVFHSGMSMEPGVSQEYGRPILFEPIVRKYSNMRICLSHFAFPYTRELAAMMCKYPNLYTDTAMLYFDSAYEFFRHEFKDVLGITWIDRALRHQIMFGADMPRFEQMRMLAALRKLGLREETLQLLTEQNALDFISGTEVRVW